MSEKIGVDNPDPPLTAHEKRQVLGEATMSQSFSFSSENAATILALLGKAKKEERSPTAIVMLQNLHDNMSVLFNKMIRNETDIAIIRVAGPTADDRKFEYAKILKDGNMTKCLALSSFLNFLQQNGVHDQIELMLAEESDRYFEFVVRVITY